MPNKISPERYDLLLEAAQKAETAELFSYEEFDDALEFRLVQMQKEGLKNFAADDQYNQLFTAYNHTKNIYLKRRDVTYPAASQAIDEAMLDHAAQMNPGQPVDFAKAMRQAEATGDDTFNQLEKLRRRF